MRYVDTDFTSATNPALTPIPFDAIVEQDGTVDVHYDAAAGNDGFPGMSIEYSGGLTGIVGYGQVNLTNKTGTPIIVPAKRNRPTHGRLGFYLAIPNAAGFANGNELKIIRFMHKLNGVETELCSLTLIKRAANYAWKISEALGNTTVTGANFNPTGFTYGTHYGWCVDLFLKSDGTGLFKLGARWPFGHASQTGANIEVRFPVGTMPGVPTRLDVGVVSATIAAPSAASEINIGSLRYEDNLLDNPGFLVPGREFTGDLRGPRDLQMAWCLPIDNAQVGIAYSKYTEVGAPVPTHLGLGGGGAVWSKMTTNIPIDEGAIYEISSTMVEPVVPNAHDPCSAPSVLSMQGAVLGRGYTQMQGCTFNDETHSWESVPYWGAAQPIKPHSYIAIGEKQNCIRLYNGEFKAMELYIRRLRFL